MDDLKLGFASTESSNILDATAPPKKQNVSTTAQQSSYLESSPDRRRLRTVALILSPQAFAPTVFGSKGNLDGDRMCAAVREIVMAQHSMGLVVDLSEFEYRFGDWIGAVP